MFYPEVCLLWIQTPSNKSVASKVPLITVSFIWTGEEANMAAKVGDNPDSLMTLATVFCLRNLRKTMCYQGFGSKLCLRPDIFLPSEICDKLVNKYVMGDTKKWQNAPWCHWLLCLHRLGFPFDFCSHRYMELVHTDSNFEPEESFFQLFSDPRSTRLTRVQLKEDFVRDRDLEAIRKQVSFCRVSQT